MHFLAFRQLYFFISKLFINPVYTFRVRITFIYNKKKFICYIFLWKIIL